MKWTTQNMNEWSICIEDRESYRDWECFPSSWDACLGEETVCWRVENTNSPPICMEASDSSGQFWIQPYQRDARVGAAGATALKRLQNKVFILNLRKWEQSKNRTKVSEEHRESGFRLPLHTRETFALIWWFTAADYYTWFIRAPLSPLTFGMSVGSSNRSRESRFKDLKQLNVSVRYLLIGC